MSKYDKSFVKCFVEYLGRRDANYTLMNINHGVRTNRIKDA